MTMPNVSGFLMMSTMGFVQVDLYGYIHLDDGNSVTQLGNHSINITYDETGDTQELNTDSYGFFYQMYMATEEALNRDTITIDVSYYDPGTSNTIEGSTTMTLSASMRADPTFTLLRQECDWYEDIEAPHVSNSPHSDQTITDIYFSQEYIFVGDIVTIYADVTNIGDADLPQNTIVRFYDGDTLIPGGEKTIDLLDVGATKTVDAEWACDYYGEHPITVVVGEDKAFPEVAMDNNDRLEEAVGLTDAGDYDCDDLLDEEECEIYGTNPLDPDTDNDGLPDGWEVFNSLSPLNDGIIDPIHGPNGDQDGDGLINLYEYQNSYNRDGNPSSDPWNPDTDYDSFSDYEELNGFQISGGATSWVEQFESGDDYGWYVEQSDENNMFGLSTEKYISCPYGLYLETTSGGYAYGTTPSLEIDLTSQYSISFYFRLADDTNTWIEVVMNGHVRLLIDSGTDLK
jgi:hypothetical protein